MLVLERRRVAAREVLQVLVPVHRVRELVGELLEVGRISELVRPIGWPADRVFEQDDLLLSLLLVGLVRHLVVQLKGVVEDAVRDRSARCDQHVRITLHIERLVERRTAAQRLQTRVAVQLPVVSRANVPTMVLEKVGERIVEVGVPVDRLGQIERNIAVALGRLRQCVVGHDIGAFRIILVRAVGVVVLELLDSVRGVQQEGADRYEDHADGQQPRYDGARGEYRLPGGQLLLFERRA